MGIQGKGKDWETWTIQFVVWNLILIFGLVTTAAYKEEQGEDKWFMQKHSYHKKILIL